MAIGPIPDSYGDDEEEGGGGIFAEINITPVADLFLVLLIIVLVGAPAAAAEMIERASEEARSGLDINLPTGETQEIDPGASSLVVEIPREGNVVVNGSEVTDEELDALFQGAFARDATTQVVLRADEGVFHGRVVNVMERARQRGLSRLAIATRGGT
jgi:biopolymer transport protein ExbD